MIPTRHSKIVMRLMLLVIVVAYTVGTIVLLKG